MAGPASLYLSGSNNFTGAMSINGGVLTLGNSAALAATTAIQFGGGTLQYMPSNTADYSARIVNNSAAIAVDTNGQTVNYATPLAASNVGGLTKLNTGKLTLNGVNAYAGLTTVSGGSLVVNGSLLVDDSTFKIAATLFPIHTIASCVTGNLLICS